MTMNDGDSNWIYRSESDSIPPTPSFVQRFQSGDNSAWRTFYWIYYPRVCRQCLRCNLTDQDARDVAQEVFIRVYRYRSTFKGKTFGAWLNTITYRELCDFFARRGRDVISQGIDFEEWLKEVPAMVEPSSSGTSTPTANDVARRQALEAILADLPEKIRKALIGVDEGRSSKEVGKEVGMSAGQVRVWIHRIRKRRRKEFPDLFT
jgi:RNA polymerase sigma-70 factor (ECF subfamily)